MPAFLRDHPRVCGEKYAPACGCIRQRGSPPRMRGKADGYSGLFCITRITPAYAGKSPGWGSGIYCDRDHPRVCGEKSNPGRQQPMHTGSPPRMRGKDRLRGVLGLGMGITPAYAGKRRDYLSQNLCRKDHPRVCGEKRPVRRGACSGPGSPPRMRGKVIRGLATRITSGITPAYAGKRGC